MEPPATPPELGISWAAATLADAPVLAKLYNAVAAAEGTGQGLLDDSLTRPEGRM